MKIDFKPQQNAKHSLQHSTSIEKNNYCMIRYTLRQLTLREHNLEQKTESGQNKLLILR